MLITFVFEPVFKTLHLIDYKSGGFPVYPEENYQLGLYALIMQQTYNFKKLYFHIFQDGEAKVWEVDMDWLKELVETLKKVLDKLGRGVVEYVYGERSCNSCFNRSNCVVYNERKSKLMEEAYEQKEDD